MYINAGGVTVSYFEWLKNISHAEFGRIAQSNQSLSEKEPILHLCKESVQDKKELYTQQDLNPCLFDHATCTSPLLQRPFPHMASILLFLLYVDSRSLNVSFLALPP